MKSGLDTEFIYIHMYRFSIHMQPCTSELYGPCKQVVFIYRCPLQHIVLYTNTEATPRSHKNMVFEERWSLATGSFILKYAGNVVFPDKWPIMTVDWCFKTSFSTIYIDR